MKIGPIQGNPHADTYYLSVLVLYSSNLSHLGFYAESWYRLPSFGLLRPFSSVILYLLQQRSQTHSLCQLSLFVKSLVFTCPHMRGMKSEDLTSSLWKSNCSSCSYNPCSQMVFKIKKITENPCIYYSLKSPMVQMINLQLFTSQCAISSQNYLLPKKPPPLKRKHPK